MFRLGKLGNGRNAAPPTDKAVEEGKGEGKDASTDETDKDPEEYWQVKPPTDDLDRLMWGEDLAPPPAPAPMPKYNKDWASSAEKDEDGGNIDEDGEGEKVEGAVDEGDEDGDDHDNILSALEISAKDQKPPPPPPPPPDAPPEPPASDKIMLEDIVWKQRSGFGKYSFGILQHEWEQRRVVLFESGMLRYYSLKEDMEGVKYDPQHATDPDKSPWVYDQNQEPRGEMNLKAPEHSTHNVDEGEGGRTSTASSSFGDSLGDGVRRLSSLARHDKNLNAGGVKVQARERRKEPGPTPFEIDITRKDNHELWRFCFQSQSIQMEWLNMLKRAASDEGDDDNDDNIADVADGLANHGFEPGDHIIRWEMLPVLYPIQIHGIVLEAGSNCVIIADFGLASYNPQKMGGGDLDTLSEEGKDDSHDVIMAAWEKIKPKEKKRLNVIAVTDPKEIRKWSKISYGDQVEKDKKPGFFKSLFKSPKNAEAHKTIDENGAEMEEEGEGGAATGECEENEGSDDANTGTPAVENGQHIEQDDARQRDNEDEQHNANESTIIEGAPEWFQPGYRPRKRTGSSSSTIPLNDDGQSVFSIDKPEDHAHSQLPKSDSAKLVLARTHFVLEHEDLLPPYHVFYSNSECIAVWCKTGRWSTLQAAVYLVSSSFGFGKSATMLTLSMAAAHAILVPALAVGGLAVVSAPLLFLRKSQEKWEKATMLLTDAFWSRADSEVFVEAIEYWGRKAA